MLSETSAVASYVELAPDKEQQLSEMTCTETSLLPHDSPSAARCSAIWRSKSASYLVKLAYLNHESTASVPITVISHNGRLQAMAGQHWTRISGLNMIGAPPLRSEPIAYYKSH